MINFIKFFFLILILHLPFEIFAEVEFHKSLVQVDITYQDLYYQAPWKKKDPGTVSAVGIVVPGKKILVLASLIRNATLIQVKKYSSYGESRAYAIRKDTESDLALLDVPESEFFDDLEPVRLQSVINYPEEVFVMQLDNSASLQTSVASISGIEMTDNFSGYSDLPMMDINSSESLAGKGELISNGEEMLGMVYNFRSQSNSGIAIPSFIIKKFLEAKSEPIFPHKGFYYRLLTDKASQEFYGINTGNQGVLVDVVIPYSGADGILRSGDIILKFGNRVVDSKGYIEHPLYGKQSFSFLAHSGSEFGYELNKKVPIEILRDKKILEVELPLHPFPEKAIQIPHRKWDPAPNYLIMGGYVFLELSEFLLQEWGRDWRSKAPNKLVYLYDYKRLHSKRGDAGHIVLLRDVLPIEFNKGYHDMSLQIVETANGKPVSSVPELEKLIKNSSESVPIIELENGVEIGIDKEKLQSADLEIQKKYDIQKLKGGY